MRSATLALLLFIGFAVESSLALAQPEMVLRERVLSWLFVGGSPWLGISAFYLVPFVVGWLVASALCRWPAGKWLVLGALLFDVWMVQLNWDAYSRFSAYGGCGWGALHWRLVTSFLPYALAKMLVLRRAFFTLRRRRRLRGGGAASRACPAPTS